MIGRPRGPWRVRRGRLSQTLALRGGPPDTNGIAYEQFVGHGRQNRRLVIVEILAVQVKVAMRSLRASRHPPSMSPALSSTADRSPFNCYGFPGTGTWVPRRKALGESATVRSFAPGRDIVGFRDEARKATAVLAASRAGTGRPCSSGNAAAGRHGCSGEWRQHRSMSRQHATRTGPDGG